MYDRTTIAPSHFPTRLKLFCLLPCDGVFAVLFSSIIQTKYKICNNSVRISSHISLNLYIMDYIKPLVGNEHLFSLLSANCLRFTTLLQYYELWGDQYTFLARLMRSLRCIHLKHFPQRHASGAGQTCSVP